MRNSRLDRILYIQQVLVQGGVLNKQQTADRFGVSEKTIQRDLDTLRSYFADSEPRREILYNSAKGGYLLDDTLSRFLTSSEIRGSYSSECGRCGKSSGNCPAGSGNAYPCRCPQ